MFVGSLFFCALLTTSSTIESAVPVMEQPDIKTAVSCSYSEDNSETSKNLTDEIIHDITSDRNSIPSETFASDKSSVTITKMDSPPLKKTVTLTNTISGTMCSYTYFGTSYEPTFTFTANGTIIPYTTTETITLENDTLTLAYEADFYNGVYHSADQVSVTIDQDNAAFSVAFDWHKTPRIVVVQKTDN